jgi:poly(U)-specific endoribonuclease
MAAFTPNPLQRLLQQVEQRLVWVRKLLADKGEPPFDVCSSVFKDMGDQLTKLTLQAPVRVKKIVSGAFSSAGWDAPRGAAVLRTITLEKLATCLQTVTMQLSNYNLTPPEPSAAELQNISLAAQRLWELDHNRLEPGTDFVLDLQGEKSPSDHRDLATRPLFKWVDPNHLERPTFKAFLSLLDNYVADEGVSEKVTKEEREENDAFLNLCLDTAVMQYAHKFLAQHKKVPTTREGFLAALNNAWFGLYRRKTPNDSSGFEHVFLGEREGEKVAGLHCWLQLRSEELAKRLKYKGRIRPRRRIPRGFPAEQFISIQFEWMGQEKFISSSLVGTSPEFEMALYSLCWFSGAEESTVFLGPHKVCIKTFTIRQHGGLFIGSAFPEEEHPDEDDKNRAARVIQKPFLRKRGTHQH